MEIEFFSGVLEELSSSLTYYETNPGLEDCNCSRAVVH